MRVFRLYHHAFIHLMVGQEVATTGQANWTVNLVPSTFNTLQVHNLFDFVCAICFQEPDVDLLCLFNAGYEGSARTRQCTNTFATPAQPSQPAGHWAGGQPQGERRRSPSEHVSPQEAGSRAGGAFLTLLHLRYTAIQELLAVS